MAGRSQSGLSHHAAFSSSASASASASSSPHFRASATPSIYHSNTNASPLSHAHSSSSSSSPVPRQPSPILTRPHTSLAQILPTTTTNTTFTVVPRPEPSNTAIYASTADSYSFVGLPTPNPLRYFATVGQTSPITETRPRIIDFAGINDISRQEKKFTCFFGSSISDIYLTFLRKQNYRLCGLLNCSIFPRLVDDFSIFDTSIAALSSPTRRPLRSRSSPSAPSSTSCPMIGSHVRWCGLSRLRPRLRRRLRTWRRRVRFRNSVSSVSLAQMMMAKSTARPRRVRKRALAPMRWEALLKQQQQQQHQRRRMLLMRPPLVRTHRRFRD